MFWWALAMRQCKENDARLPAGNIKRHRPFLREVMAEVTKEVKEPIVNEDLKKRCHVRG